jgi:chemotaxis protein MotB
MAKPVEAPPSEGAPEWMVSYADMITILMAFFVVMYSMAGTKDAAKQDPVMSSLRKQFGRFTGSPSGKYVPRSAQLAGVGAGPVKRVGAIPGGAEPKAPIGENARVTTIRPGGQVTIGGVIYFEEGASDLGADQERQLQLVVQELSGKPQKIEIRGHTTSRGQLQDSSFRDNWDLAYARCHRTIESLIAQGIDPKRLRVSVAGQYEPIHAGTDAVLMKKNGRVEIFMLNEFAERLQGTPEERAAVYVRDKQDKHGKYEKRHHDDKTHSDQESEH